MPYRKEQFVTGEIYHITLRALDNSLLFKDEKDYYRMIFSVYEFNNKNRVSIKDRREARVRWKNSPRGRASGEEEEDKREKMVDILAFCWMNNHIHLLLRQLEDGGIQKFMSKVGTGFARYFNDKYQRKGHLFQNRFGAVHIENDEQLKTVFVYIHTNPIALIEPGWKENGIINSKKVIEFLENYKWSSYQDYLGKKNFPSVIECDFLLEIMGGGRGCKDFVDNWVQYKGEIPRGPSSRQKI